MLWIVINMHQEQMKGLKDIQVCVVNKNSEIFEDPGLPFKSNIWKKVGR